MFTLTVQKILTSNVYRVTITTSLFDAADVALMAKYVEPMIEVGGNIADANVDYTIKDLLQVSLKTGFGAGVTKQWSGDGDDNPMQKANAWANVVYQRIITAMNLLRMQFDQFTSTQTQQV